MSESVCLLLLISDKIWFSLAFNRHHASRNLFLSTNLVLTKFNIVAIQELLQFALLHFALKKLLILRWKVITFRINNFVTFCVDIITFCVSITFCGDCYYILRQLLHFAA